MRPHSHLATLIAGAMLACAPLAATMASGAANTVASAAQGLVARAGDLSRAGAPDCTDLVKLGAAFPGSPRYTCDAHYQGNGIDIKFTVNGYASPAEAGGPLGCNPGDDCDSSGGRSGILLRRITAGGITFIMTRTREGLVSVSGHRGSQAFDLTASGQRDFAAMEALLQAYPWSTAFP